MIESDIRKLAELKLVEHDAQFCWRISRDLAEIQGNLWIPLLCMISYLSLVIHESSVYMIRNDPSLKETLELKFADIIKQSRQRVKLFDDNRLGIDGVADYFSQSLIETHKRAFIDPVRLPLAEYWKTDLGLMHYQGRLISTTHQVHFNLGTPPEMIEDHSGKVPLGVGEDIGRFFSLLARSDARPSFLVGIDQADIEQSDVRSEAFYRNSFNGELDDGRSASLTAFRCTLNWLDLFHSGDLSPESQVALFKLRFVTLYHVLAGLRDLNIRFPEILGDNATRVLTEIEGDPTSLIFRSDSARQFRNILVHYRLDTRLRTTDLVLGRPMSGLTEIYFPDFSFERLAEHLRMLVTTVANKLDHWAMS